jgi:hypothetical protein
MKRQLLALLICGILGLSVSAQPYADEFACCDSHAPLAIGIDAQHGSNGGGTTSAVQHGSTVTPVGETAAINLTVYVTKTGKKYHRGSCRYLKKSKIAIELSEAKKRYGACKVCKPPQ